MAPKKHSGFMAFVHEWRKNNPEGRRMSVAQAVTKCGDVWKKMDAQQRGPYLTCAKDLNVAARSNTERLNCKGQPLSAVDAELKMIAERDMQMKRTTDRLVMSGKDQHDLENTKFIFIAFNYFIKSTSTDYYIPAEFAACQFSLKSGRTSTYSSLINPGHLIFGLCCETMQHSASTHQLPVPPNALGESDIGQLYANIVEYLRSCQPSANPDDPLVVFTSSELMPVVKGCLKYLESEADETLATISVCDIQYLLYVLKMEVLDIADLPADKFSKAVTDAYFLNDYYEYQSGISCQFHEDKDRGSYCVESKVTRWCYQFSDYMCGDLAIKPLPGKHFPPKQVMMYRVIDPETNPEEFTPRIKTEKLAKPSSLAPHGQHVDHSAFSGDLNAAEDFPALGRHHAKAHREPPAKSSNVRDPRSAWYVPPSNSNN